MKLLKWLVWIELVYCIWNRCVDMYNIFFLGYNFLMWVLIVLVKWVLFILDGLYKNKGLNVFVGFLVIVFFIVCENLLLFFFMKFLKL